MKKSLFLLLVFFLNITASAYSQVITLDLGTVTLKEAFKKIGKETNVDFFYSNDELNVHQTVNVRLRDTELAEAVSSLVGVHYNVEVNDENIVIITPKKHLVKAQEIRVRGVVTDENGAPFPGVNILVKGTRKGVVTDIDGNYSLNVEDDAVLVFSFIGYKTEEIAVSGRSEINLKMTVDVAELSEVVVTGIFERQAESFTGSAVTISKEDLKRVGNANLFQTLRNVDPSMVVLDNFEMGSNPNALPDLQIRGTSTFPPAETGLEGNLKGNYLKNPNQPLFILNGFEASVEQVFDLDINRIENVTILKDAASKAIYGSRAANGVVVIETKRLSANNTLVSYNASVDIEMPDLTSYNLTNALEKLEAERIDGMYTPNSEDPEEYSRLQQLYNSRRKLALEGLDTYWLSKPLQTGVGQRHSLSVEMGGEDLRVLANISYRNVEGVMKGSYRNNIAGNLTTSYRVRNLSFKNIMSVNSNNAEESPYGTFNEYARMNPYWRSNLPDGSIPYYAELGPNGERYTNPLYNSTLESKIASNYLNFTNNFYLEWRILQDLKATARIGVDYKANDADEFYPSSHTKFDHLISEEDKKRRGSYQVNNGKGSKVSGDFNINYTKEINKHFLFGNVGFNINEEKFNEIIHRVEGFPSSRMDNIVFGRAYALDSRPTGINGISRDIGFLAVGSYMYDNRFLADATLRTNASSKFGADRRWANFWSLGLGWNLHNESLLQSTMIEKLKIRGSLGSTGNQNFMTNASLATYSYYLESLYQGFTGSYLENMANSGLQWESKFDYNAGFDAELHNISLRFDYYESYTENLITDITIPNSTGFTSVKDNLGRVKNSGIELYASYLAFSNAKGFITLNFGLTTNKNEIISLSNSMRSYNEAMEKEAAERGNNKPVHKYEDGMSMDAIWAVPSLGIDPSTGNEIYLDRFGNTTYEWDARDMVVVGNSNPDFRGNFGFSAEYKGIGLNIMCRYLGGGQLYNQTLVDKVENVDMNYNVDKRVLSGRWLYPGQHALFKRLGTYSVDTDGDGAYESFDEMTRATSRFVQDLNELDIAAVNVYYDFDRRLLQNIGLERLKLSFNMNEVAKLSSIKIERGTIYPFARTMSFSLLATF